MAQQLDLLTAEIEDLLSATGVEADTDNARQFRAAVLQYASEASIYSLDDIMRANPNLESHLLEDETPVFDDKLPYSNPYSVFHRMSKRDLFVAAPGPEDYCRLLKLRAPNILENYASYGPANMINVGGFPSHKKVTVIQHKLLRDTFPGLENLLPPYTGEGSSYPDDFDWAVWMQSPVSKTYKDGHYGAFMVVAKPYTCWLEVAQSPTGRTDPDHPAHPMWSPVTLLNALENDPATLMGLSEGTSLTAARLQAAKTMREAPWAVKRLMTYVVSYKFLQQHVVQPAFLIQASGASTVDEISKHIGNKFGAIPILPQSLPKVTVNLTDHVRTYAAWLSSDNSSYGPIMALMSGFFDKTIGYQPHRVDSNNRIEFLSVVSKPPRRSAAAENTPLHKVAVTNPSPVPYPSTAGAVSRTMTSPSKPGAPKTRRFVDVARPSIAPSTSGTTSGPPPPMTAPPFPYGYPPHPAYSWPFPGYPPYPQPQQQPFP